MSGPLKRLLTAAALASDARLVRTDSGAWEAKGDPTEAALVAAAAKADLLKEELEAKFPRVDEIPFTSETKRMTTLHRVGDSMVAYAKGAPEVIVDFLHAASTAWRRHRARRSQSQAKILETARQLAAEALRVLAVAVRENATRESAEREMTFLGLVGMIDPPRPEARFAVQRCEKAGIRPVMITGDHPVTAEAVARELGLLKTGRVVTGAELEAMSEDGFRPPGGRHRCLRSGLARPQVTGGHGLAARRARSWR